MELTKNQNALAIDINAYNDLLTTFFSKVSQVAQLKILAFVKKTWQNNESFTEMAYSTLHTTMRKNAKTLGIRQQVEALLLSMEKNPLVMACRDVRYDAIDLGPIAYAPSGIVSAGGGARE